ncbi:MAG: cation acetate symporter [Burkholderiales bacterium]|nr:cation acetate symporter [Burkholderiales bacterium]MDE1926792.1 cation acetate symporter [Burkholderiales bacterium]MDE2158370.1 cation acetate symporter [Burkholderiales bacterium]MDE2502500.1 cation acetate symporter [Burkholderiales bacterium]
MGAMALGERHGLPRGWIGASFLVLTVAAYAGIGFLCRTSNEVEYFVAGRRVPALFNGLATAADWMSAASFIGTAGVLFLHGFSGLAYILGWTGGYCLLALLLAPFLRRFGQYTIPDFLGARYGGRMPRAIGALATIGVSFVYVVVQIYGVGLITSHLTGFGFELGIFVGLGGVLVCSFLGGMRAVTWTQVAQYLVLILAYLIPLTWLSVKQTGSLTPLVSYGTQLMQIETREAQLIADPAERQVAQRLRERAALDLVKLGDVRRAMADDEARERRRIADLRRQNAPLVHIQRAERDYAQRPRTAAQARAAYEHDREVSLSHALPLAGMPPQTQPYAGAGPESEAAGQGGMRSDRARVNFIALMLCLMMGTAAMPHVLTRYYTTPSAAEARKSVAWSLLFITLLYLAAPVLAVLVKYEVLQHLVGMPIDHLPAWVGRWSRLDPNLVSVRDVNGDGILQLGELVIGGDVVVLAAPEIGGLPYWVSCLVAAGGLAAALSTADGLLLTIANAISHDIYFRSFNPRASAANRVIASKVLVMAIALVAATIAAHKSTDILEFVSAAFSLAAAAFFPALVLGIFWRRANGSGAVAGMLAGLAVCGWYMATNLAPLRALFGVTLPLAACRWFGVDAIAAGVFAVPTGFLVMIVVSLLTPAPGPEVQTLIDRMRFPGAALN